MLKSTKHLTREITLHIANIINKEYLQNYIP